MTLVAICKNMLLKSLLPLPSHDLCKLSERFRTMKEDKINRPIIQRGKVAGCKAKITKKARPAIARVRCSEFAICSDFHAIEIKIAVKESNAINPIPPKVAKTCKYSLKDESNLRFQNFESKNSAGL